MTSLSTPTEEAYAEIVRSILEFGPSLLHEPVDGAPVFSHLFGEAYAGTSLFLDRTVKRAAPVRSQSVQRSGCGIQVDAGGEVYHGSTSDPSRTALFEAASSVHAAAGTTLRNGSPPCASPPLPTLPPDAPLNASAREKIFLMEEAADAALALDVRVRSARIQYADAARMKVVLSDGGAVAGAEYHHGMRVEIALAGRNGSITGIAHGGAAAGLGYYLEHPPSQTARGAVQQAVELAEARPLESDGETAVVFGPGWGGVWLHEALGHLLEADVAGRAGREASRIGRPIGPEWMVLDDDKSLPGGRGSYRVDDEGTAASVTRLVEGGRVASHLTDLPTASTRGSASTGNARRKDYRSAALPRMSNLVLRPGGISPADLMADVREGILITNPEGGTFHPSENKITVFARMARRIEGGRVTGAISSVAVELRVEDIPRRLAAAASDFELETARGFCEKHGQVVPISVGQPTVLFSALRVFPGHGA